MIIIPFYFIYILYNNFYYKSIGLELDAISKIYNLAFLYRIFGQQ